MKSWVAINQSYFYPKYSTKRLRPPLKDKRYYLYICLEDHLDSPVQSDELAIFAQRRSEEGYYGSDQSNSEGHQECLMGPHLKIQ